MKTFDRKNPYTDEALADCLDEIMRDQTIHRRKPFKYYADKYLIPRNTIASRYKRLVGKTMRDLSHSMHQNQSKTEEMPVLANQALLNRIEDLKKLAITKHEEGFVNLQSDALVVKLGLQANLKKMVVDSSFIEDMLKEAMGLLDNSRYILGLQPSIDEDDPNHDARFDQYKFWLKEIDNHFRDIAISFRQIKDMIRATRTPMGIKQIAEAQMLTEKGVAEQFQLIMGTLGKVVTDQAKLAKLKPEKDEEDASIHSDFVD